MASLLYTTRRSVHALLIPGVHAGGNYTVIELHILGG